MAKWFTRGSGTVGVWESLLGSINGSATLPSLPFEKAVSDTWTPVFGVSISSLVKSGTFPKAVSDTWLPVFTATVLRPPADESAVTDTWTPVFSASVTLDTVSDSTQDVTDTWTPVWTTLVTIDGIAGTVDVAVSDTWTPRFAVAVSVPKSGDVDMIHITSRPYGYIQLTEI